jgi:hypothetical protein
MNAENFEKYKNGEKYNYYGGRVTTSPYRHDIQRYDHWYVVLDEGGDSLSYEPELYIRKKWLPPVEPTASGKTSAKNRLPDDNDVSGKTAVITVNNTVHVGEHNKIEGGLNVGNTNTLTSKELAKILDDALRTHGVDTGKRNHLSESFEAAGPEAVKTIVRRLVDFGITQIPDFIYQIKCLFK